MVLGNFLGWLLSKLLGLKGRKSYLVHIHMAEESIPIEVLFVRRLIPRWALAQTWGNKILYAGDPPLDFSVLSHEVVHVMQWKKHGFLFPFLYAWASLEAWLFGEHYYWDNAFEVEARKLSSGELTFTFVEW